MENNELDLIHRAQMGDTEAFDNLVRLHDRQVLQLAFSVLLNLQDAQDVYQETFMKAFVNISSFRFESEFSTWLNRIALNLSINRYRQRKMRQWFSLEQKQEEQSGWDLQVPETEMLAPETSLHSGEIKRAVASGLRHLSPQQRAVFVLKHLHGYKITQIAESLDCAEGTVKNQLFRATRKLRKLLKPLLQEEAGK